MTFERIFGLLFSGFMCKLYAACLAIWMASQAISIIQRTFGAVSKGFGQ